jgi:hypothetical protein
MTTTTQAGPSGHRSDPSAHRLILLRVFSAVGVHGGSQHALTSSITCVTAVISGTFASFPAVHCDELQHCSGSYLYQVACNIEPTQNARVTPSPNLAKVTIYACPWTRPLNLARFLAHARLTSVRSADMPGFPSRWLLTSAPSRSVTQY